MSHPHATQEIKDALQQRKVEIKQELTQVEKALRALQKEDTKSPAPRRKSKRRRIDTEKVMDTINAYPGITGVQVAQKMRLPTSSAYSALNRLREQGRVVKTGTVWYPAQRKL